MEINKESHKGNKLKKFFAYFLIYNGAMFSIASMTGLFAGTSEGMSMFAGGMLMGAIPLFFGIRILKSLKKETNQLENAHQEKIILNLVNQNKGYITATEISMNSEYTIEDAKKILDNMVIKGYATTEVTDEGAVKYVFPELLK